MSHLHFDHAGGLLRADGSKAFPRATIVAQRAEWEIALDDNSRIVASYDQPELRLVRDWGEAGAVDGERELLPGVSVVMTGGHSKGHQAIVVRGTDRRETLAFFGDLGMRPWSANPRWVTSFDDFPLDSVEVKGELFARAVDGGLAHRAEPRAADADRPADARSGPLPLRPGLIARRSTLPACSGWRSATATTSTSMVALEDVFEDCDAGLARRDAQGRPPVHRPGRPITQRSRDAVRRRYPGIELVGGHHRRRDVLRARLRGGLDRAGPVRLGRRSILRAGSGATSLSIRRAAARDAVAEARSKTTLATGAVHRAPDHRRRRGSDRSRRARDRRSVPNVPDHRRRVRRPGSRSRRSRQRPMSHQIVDDEVRRGRRSRSCSSRARSTSRSGSRPAGEASVLAGWSLGRRWRASTRSTGGQRWRSSSATSAWGSRRSRTRWPSSRCRIRRPSTFEPRRARMPPPGCVAFFGTVPEGSTVQITTAGTEQIFEGARASVASALARYPAGRSPTAALLYSCTTRRFLLGTRAGHEVELAQDLLGDAVPIAGFYCLGEIAPVESVRRTSRRSTTRRSSRSCSARPRHGGSGRG